MGLGGRGTIGGGSKGWVIGGTICGGSRGWGLGEQLAVGLGVGWSGEQLVVFATLSFTEDNDSRYFL